jgi:23S rRNA (cytosine1962-C5)-methyltransferase
VREIVLKAGREKSLLRRHPWIFSGAIERSSGDPEPGETVTVRSAQGRFLAQAAISPRSQIRARAWSFDEREVIDARFMQAALERAVAFRSAVLPADTDACRLVHAESDGLPGLVIDRYGDTAVMQCSSAGADRWRDAYADALLEAGVCRRVYERSDTEPRNLEGLAPRAGALRGGEPPQAIAIREGPARFLVDVRQGQKTGFFIDQRDNRARVRACAQGCEVLDVFSYTGGFVVAALLGGASTVTAIESSAEAIERARQNLAASGLAADRVEWQQADAFARLRALHAQGRRYDLIVLDPPKFAPTERHVARAARAYKDINLWACRLLRPGGTLFTFSCSGAIDGALFQSIVAGAASDAGVLGRVVARLGAAPDHPVALNFPEGEYLKGLVVRVA